MKHDELLERVIQTRRFLYAYNIIRAVVELHKPTKERSVEPLCNACTDIWFYPCPTIQAIEKELP